MDEPDHQQHRGDGRRRAFIIIIWPTCKQTHPFRRLPVLTLLKVKKKLIIKKKKKGNLFPSQFVEHDDTASPLFFSPHPLINETVPRIQFMPNILTFFKFTN